MPSLAHGGSGGGGGGGSTSLAVVASTVSGLGAGSDGTIGRIKVGSAPDVEYVELVYDATNSMWVSEARELIAQADQQYMGCNGTTYAYLGQSNTGSTTAASMGWSTRPVRKATTLYAAGLRLQMAASAIIQGSSVPAAFTVQAKLFQHADSASVVFSSDGSTAVAELATALVSPASNVVTFKSTGWVEIVKNGLATQIGSSDITAANLWPRLYGKVASGVAYGSIIDCNLQYRWVG